MTPPVFGAYRTRDGLNSYEILAESVGPRGAGAVLDLACGDGFLLRFVLPKLGRDATAFAVDMVPSEIERAKRDCRDPRARFLCETAQDLSVPAGSIDLVLCHMALMLMLPIEPVLDQVRRVLKPGGRLAAVVGGPRPPDSPSAEIGRTIGRFLKESFPGMAAPRTGDERFGGLDGLKDLFGPARGFSADLEVRDFEIELKGGVEDVWDFYKDMYLVGMLPRASKAALRAEMEKTLKRLFPDGRMLIPWPMRRFAVSVPGAQGA